MEGPGLAPRLATGWPDVDTPGELVPVVPRAFRFAMVSQMAADRAGRWQTAADNKISFCRRSCWSAEVLLGSLWCPRQDYQKMGPGVTSGFPRGTLVIEAGFDLSLID